MSSLKNKNILLCVTGSIAAYKACELLRTLRKEGANIQVMMSYSAEKFIGKATFSALSNNKVLTNLFSEESSQSIEHVDLSFKLDLVVVAPATANIICKAAQGVADEIVSTTLSICDVPILFAPAMNFRMWENKATIDAIKKIKKRGNIIVEPEEGYLASLHKGKGRLADINIIFNQIKKVFHYNLILENQNILITAGPTIENIDSVRYISNKSSGKMGYSLANAAKYYGGNVTLISGPVALDKIPGIQHFDITSAKDMEEEVKNIIKKTNFNFIFMVAAVADYRPIKVPKNKIKSNNSELTIHLEKTTDILKDIIPTSKAIKIGFALETDNGIENAKMKMNAKDLDYILLNFANEKDAGFNTDTNHIYLFSKNGDEYEFALDTKYRLSLKILEYIYKHEKSK